MVVAGGAEADGAAGLKGDLEVGVSDLLEQEGAPGAVGVDEDAGSGVPPVAAGQGVRVYQSIGLVEDGLILIVEGINVGKQLHVEVGVAVSGS